MRVAIDARIIPGEPGGVQQSVLGLACGLSKLDDSDDDEYLFLVHEDHEWLEPALHGPCRALVGGTAGGARGARVVRRLSGRAPLLGKAIDYALDSRGRIIPPSDGTVERAGVDLVHFMRQRGFRTSLPSIYQPHDLQHVHHPEFWNPLTRVYRRVMYRAMARQASLVAAMTSQGRDDIVEHLGVERDRVVIVPWASVLSLYIDPTGDPAAADTASLGVPERFLLYPAQTWPHKNHLRLVRAVARLRAERGLSVPVVLTGRLNEHWDTVLTETKRMGARDLVHALGFVDTTTLRALYAQTTAVVFPSLFEGWGLPVVEAFDAGAPVICSDISPLREIACDAALRFDPYDVDAIMDAVATVWTDPALRQRLVEAGDVRRKLFDWERTARMFRVHYRSLLGLPQQPEDVELVTAPAPV